MISKLTGTLLEKQPPYLVIEVNDIGYEVFATMNTFYQLPDCGQRLSLHTQLIIREDAHTLYGFHSKQERHLFRELIKVNGVGPKLALSILSGIEPDAFVQCVHQNDTSALIRIPGVGKKTAERLIIETRDKLKDWQAIAPSDLTISPSHISDDAVSALITLGYKPKDAERAIKNVYHSELSSEQLIRDALKAMMVGV